MFPRKASIALVVIVTALTITTLLLTAFGLINYRFESEEQWEHLNSNLAISADKLVNALILPIWNIDHAQIDKNLESAMKDPAIFGVVLNRESLVGFPIKARVRGARWEIKESDGRFPSAGLLVAERPITFKNKLIGTLRLFATPAFIQIRLHNMLLTTIVLIISFDLLLVLSLYFIFLHIVLKPLKKIERFALGVSSGSSCDASLRSSVFRGELDSLRSSIEKMVTLLNARFEELEQSEQRFRVLVEQAPEAILVFDINLARFADANINAERLFECRREELLASGPLRFYLPTQPDERTAAESLNDHIAQTLAGKEVVFERAIRNAQGKELYCEVRMVKLPSPDHKLIRVSCINITERKLAETALQQSEDKFRLAFQTSPDAIVLNHLEDGLVIDVNQGFTSLTGFSREDVLGRTSLEINLWHNPADRERHFQSLRERGYYENMEVQFRRKDSSILTALVSARVLMLGEVPHILFIARDISERKKMEQTLRESEEKYRLLAENATDFIWTINLESMRFTYVSPSAIKMGYTPQEALELPLAQRISPESLEQVMNVLQEELANENIEGVDPKRSRTLEAQQLTKNGTTRWVEATVSFIRDAVGRPVDILGVTRDITERKQAEEKVIEGAEKLRKSMEGIVQAMAATIEVRDPYTAGHQRRVADLSKAIAKEMGFSEDQIIGIHMAGMIHDLGKLSVPAEILSKPTQLSEIEFNLIKTHPRAGYEILKEIDFPWPIARIVFQHHERIDGSGYPLQVKGEDILPEAKVLMVADVVEAIASHRPYRPAHGIDKALEEIEKNKDVLYDSEVVDICLRLFRDKGFKLA